MAPATVTADGRITVTLDEHTLAVAREAAREAVDRHMETCPIVQEFREMHADMYGVKGEKETHPGLVGHVQSLLQTRGRMYVALALIGSAVVALLGAWADKIFGG
jgi:hypothetical protein